MAQADSYVGVSDTPKPFAPGDREYKAYLKKSITGRQLTGLNSNLDPWFETIQTPIGPREYVIKGLTNAQKPTAGCVYLFERKHFIPMMVSAAMMKAGFLTLFWLMGYKCLNNPLVGLVGQRIADSFNSQARENSSHKFWSEFENAYALIESRGFETEEAAVYTPWYTNTIASKHALELHRDAIQFAFVFVYDVEGVTVKVTFPFTRRNEDTDIAWANYTAFLRGEFRISEATESVWNGSHWQPLGLVRYMEESSPIAHAKHLGTGLTPGC